MCRRLIMCSLALPALLASCALGESDARGTPTYLAYSPGFRARYLLTSKGSYTHRSGTTGETAEYSDEDELEDKAEGPGAGGTLVTTRHTYKMRTTAPKEGAEGESHLEESGVLLQLRRQDEGQVRVFVGLYPTSLLAVLAPQTFVFLRLGLVLPEAGLPDGGKWSHRERVELCYGFGGESGLDIAGEHVLVRRFMQGDRSLMEIRSRIRVAQPTPFEREAKGGTLLNQTTQTSYYVVRIDKHELAGDLLWVVDDNGHVEKVTGSADAALSAGVRSRRQGKAETARRCEITAKYTLVVTLATAELPPVAGRR